MHQVHLRPLSRCGCRRTCGGFDRLRPHPVQHVLAEDLRRRVSWEREERGCKNDESTLKCVILIVKNNRARGINSITYEVREREGLIGGVLGVLKWVLDIIYNI